MTTGHTSCRLRADARRETIIDAAIQLFSARGFKGTTTRELAAAVGVSEPVLYEHFRTKQDLYEAMMEQIVEKAARELNELLDQHAGGADTRSFLRGAAEAVIQWFHKEPQFVRLLMFSALDCDDPGRRFHKRIRQTLLDSLSGFFETNSLQNCRDDSDSEMLAHTFICMMAHHGLLQILFDYHPPQDKGELIDRMVDLFTRGISI